MTAGGKQRAGTPLGPAMVAAVAGLAMVLTGWAATAQQTSLRPKPRPAVSAPAPAAEEPVSEEAATEAALAGEEDGPPAEDGTPPAPDAGAPDTSATDTASTTTPDTKDAPALAAPGSAAPAAAAKDSKPKPPPRDPNRGSVTNLPLPRYVSLKGKEGNARRGPGLTHRIDWVFVRAGMPLRITGEYEHWRRIEDAEGAGGWVHYSLLSGVRSAEVIADMAEFHDAPEADSAVTFKAEKGVIGWIQQCDRDWCRLSIEGEKGWVIKTALWGVDPGEIVE